VEQWEEEEGMETTFLKMNNSIEDSVENESNGYPVPDPNKAMINASKEPSGTHTNTQKTLKEEILEEITEKFLENILDMVNQNVQD
jgi:hypothetical protein